MNPSYLAYLIFLEMIVKCLYFHPFGSWNNGKQKVGFKVLWKLYYVKAVASENIALGVSLVSTTIGDQNRFSMVGSQSASVSTLA